MKKFLKYSGLCSLVLAAIAFILMMATDSVIVGSGNLKVTYAGTDAIFGNKDLLLLPKAAPLALIAWILALVGLIIVLLGVILPLLKVKALDKFAGVLNLVAVGCFVVAGIFMFIVVPSYFGANGGDVPDNAKIGAGWVIGGIIYILAGAAAICPAVVDFLGKKK